MLPKLKAIFPSKILIALPATYILIMVTVVLVVVLSKSLNINHLFKKDGTMLLIVFPYAIRNTTKQIHTQFRITSH